MGTRRTALIGLAALALSGCSTTTDVFSNVNPFKDDVVRPCPPVSILADAATQTRFKDGEGRDLLDVDFEADITALRSLCDYDVDDAGSGTLTVQTSPVVQVKRGPSNTSATAQFRYFVALTTAERQPLQRADFPAHVAFPGNMSVVSWADDTPVTLTIPVGAGQDGRSFHVFLGLQLSADELEYNRRRADSTR